MQADLDKSQFSLRPVHVKEVEGLIFISLAKKPVPFAPAQRALAPLLKPQGFTRAKVAKAVDYLVQANWKLLWENNRECYHCNVNHPQYTKANFDHYNADDTSPRVREAITTVVTRSEKKWTDNDLAPTHKQTGMTVFPDVEHDVWFSANRTPLADGWVSESMDGQQVASLMGDYPDADVGTLRIRTLPNFWNHSSCDHGVSTRLLPVGPQQTAIRVYWLVDEKAVEGRDSLFVHQPINTNGGLLRADRKESCAHAVVATRMVPKIRQRSNPQSAHVRVGIIPHQRRDLLAVHRFAHPAVRQRRAVRGKPYVVLHVGEDRHAGLLVRRREVVVGPLFFAARDDSGDRFTDARRGVVGVVMVEVGLGVLRVIDVAVVTLAVVFPEQFPVRLDEIVHRLRHFCAGETLRLEQRRQRALGGREWNRFLRQRNENQAFNFLHVDRAEAVLRLVEICMHAAAGEQSYVEAVSPLVIRADEPAHMAALLGADPRTAMPADIVQRMDDSVIGANDND